MKGYVKRSGFMAALLCTSSMALAHHGTSVTYDTSRSITLKGTVTEWVFSFPHSQIYFDVTDKDGKVRHWGSEIAPTPTMMKNFKTGWSHTSLKAGDKIVLTCAPHRDPSATACLARDLTVNGKVMAMTAAAALQALENAGKASQ